ncbi:cytochrome c oxidase subunit 4 [Kocuria sp. cx-455]|uniref:cytochrome c oxidase subunit 4 n=1 Tax=unclassified Candidatus Sulfotelmatobacter TaxID=2635724 RepID=UPI001689BB10|nr:MULTISPECIES: cytochrome c oxidase subunit 4 [unclassified Candidatus Sulfotelmatobacter]MBD2761425.1 cytochrome c oxidase subunit 4 [Kocuria sp. cx-116]MBD2765399.1 cytochrome c oxidase subunit 4 [Kocuria sp. cx-455]
MKTTVKTFILLAVFCLIVGMVYGYLTGFQELAGFPALLAVAAMSLMLAVYLWLVDRSTGAMLPEDREDGEIVEMSGDYGAFSPWSWWPLLLGIGCAIFVTALAVGWWIIGLAVPVIILGLVGLIFEHSRGEHAH